MPLPHRSNREILLHFFLPIGLGIFYIIYEAISQGNEWAIGSPDAERAIFLWLRAFFTFILLPFLVIFDVLEYLGVLSIHLGSPEWQIKMFGRLIYAILIIIVIARLLDKIL